MRYILIFIAGGLVLGSCSKEEQRDCWQAWSPVGTEVPGLALCDKTLAEAEAQFPAYWFYRVDEAKYCWRSVTNGDTIYWVKMPESMKEKYLSAGYYTHFIKVDCSSFCHCTWHEKHKSK